MARRNLLRSLLTASLLLGSSAVGILAAPSPAGAHHNPNFKPDHIVTVHQDYFDPAVVYASRGQTVQFNLAPGVSNHHTVTLAHGECRDLPESLCERNFDDPDHPPVYKFSNYGEYPFYDRYAKEAGCDMSGKIVITDDRPTVQPTNPAPPPNSCAMTSSSSSSTTTTTTQPATTTTLSPTTTTTAPTTIRPFLIGGDTGSTTTTTVAPVATAGASTSPAGEKNKGKGKGDGKNKTASTDPPTTAPPATPEGSPIEVLFDASTLTPLPESSPTTDDSTTSDSGPEESAMIDLLRGENVSDDETRLVVIGLGVLAFLGLLVGVTAWFRRSSRYFPA